MMKVAIILSVFLCADLLHLASTFKFNSDETPAHTDTRKQPEKKQKAYPNPMQGRSLSLKGPKDVQNSSSPTNSPPPQPYCKAEGITAHEDEKKYNYCFVMGTSELIHQVTDCPTGTCFESGTSCCARKACKNQSKPHPRPGKPKPSNASDSKEGPVDSTPPGKHPGKKPPKGITLYAADEQGESEVASAEMAFFYRSCRERKQKKVCKGAVHCNRTGVFPSNNDRFSYYVCERQRKSRNFIARHFNCPRRRCFKGTRCSRC